MLLDLKILNGDMPLKFDKYVNNYTVEIAEEVTKLEIDYKCNEGDLVNILNNDNLDYGLNYVFIEVTSNNKKNMYSLEIYKKKINTVFAEIDTNKNTQSEHQNFEISLFVIIFVNSIVILFTFWLIFRKKKIR